NVTLVRRDGEARVGELRYLPMDGLNHARRRVSHSRNGDARNQINERVFVRVDEHTVATRDDRNWQGSPDGRGNGCLLARQDLLRLRAGNARDEFALLRQRGATDDIHHVTVLLESVIGPRLTS